MLDYRLHELADSRFEELVGMLCRFELGSGTVVFSKGPDGGRDGRFEGTAERLPSKNAPWSGKFIIQAKHTSNAIASCSDNEFHGNKSSVIAKEIPRIIALVKNGEVDNYILFTNRKLSGDTDALVRKHIVDKTGVGKVHLIGSQVLSQMIALHWSTIRSAFPELAQAQGPLRFYRQDVAEILDAIKMALGNDKGSAPSTSFSYIDLDLKNELNNLSERYFRHIQSESSPYFGQIQDFLGDPINRDLTETYDNIASDFNHRVTVHRDDFAKFDMVFQHIHDSLIDHNSDLEKRSRLIITILHYMYWACDLGEKADDKTNTSS